MLTISFFYLGDCTWCRDPGLAIDQRCRGRDEELPEGQCLHPEDPESHVEVLENEEIDPSSTDNIVLIQPQRVKLYLRPGEAGSRLRAFVERQGMTKLWFVGYIKDALEVAKSQKYSPSVATCFFNWHFYFRLDEFVACSFRQKHGKQKYYIRINFLF